MNRGDNVRPLSGAASKAPAETDAHVLEEGSAAGTSSSRSKALQHFTPAERGARGKAARRSCRARPTRLGARRRSAATRSICSRSRRATRLPELVPIRYGRMLVSPFTFFRGGAYLMAADLADGPRTGLHAQLCGDAHLSNFGIFAAPDRRLVFSINDFDETLPGPFEWDVKRLAASFAVAGRDRGFDERPRGGRRDAAVREYREAMASFAAMRNIDVWYARLDVDGDHRPFGEAMSGKQMKRLRGERRQARARRTACARSRSCAHASTASFASSATRRSSTPIEDVLPGAEQEHLEDASGA